MKEVSILVVDDNKSVLRALEILLGFEFQDVQLVSNPNQLSSYKDLEGMDLVLLDMNFSAGVNTGNEGLFWLREIKKRSPDTAVIMMTAYGAVDLAVQALKEGASDFVLKPWNNEKLLATINSVLALKQSEKELNRLRKEQNGLKSLINDRGGTIIGQSASITEVLNLVGKVAKTDANVLITGENGTGKELVAREVHHMSARKQEVFVNVDMGSISETLFESELFGHKKGSFTDATTDRMGKFKAADRGSLFLDEIGNLGLQMQAKLLSAIQNKTVVPVGSNQGEKVDIRLICATNCNLNEMVTKGLFREDLLYRINTIHIEVPPLRERGTDVLLLARFFLGKAAKKYGKLDLRINQMAEEKLMSYSWPGNVRELEHAIERAVILCEDDVLKPNDFALGSGVVHEGNVQMSTLFEMEQHMIKKALQQHNGNYSAAAKQLGVTRQTLYNKVKKSEGI